MHMLSHCDAQRFQFTGLIRGPTHCRGCRGRNCEVSIHRPHTRPDDSLINKTFHTAVSIHRPHTRPDDAFRPCRRIPARFNSQASYEARRQAIVNDDMGALFQFTGLIRGPTFLIIQVAVCPGVSIHRPHTRPDSISAGAAGRDGCFNSQASYEARLPVQQRRPGAADVSIHRPHTRPDRTLLTPWWTKWSFNSQASYEARRYYTGNKANGKNVSIHRPHTRPDPTNGGTCKDHTSFNSQASYEARLRGFVVVLAGEIVSIHRPHTRPDADQQRSSTLCSVSIHRPHTRPDAAYHCLTIVLRVSIHRPHTRPDLSLASFTATTTWFQFTGLIRGPTRH